MGLCTLTSYLASARCKHAFLELCIVLYLMVNIVHEKKLFMLLHEMPAQLICVESIFIVINQYLLIAEVEPRLRLKTGRRAVILVGSYSFGKDVLSLLWSYRYLCLQSHPGLFWELNCVVKTLEKLRSRLVDLKSKSCDASERAAAAAYRPFLDKANSTPSRWKGIRRCRSLGGRPDSCCDHLVSQQEVCRPLSSISISGSLSVAFAQSAGSNFCLKKWRKK